MEHPKFINPEVTWSSFPDPCYDPQEKYGDCPADLLSIINAERIPAEDRIWAFANCTEISDSQKRLFSVRCVRETPLENGWFVINLIKDERSLMAIEIAEKYALGIATHDDLAVALKAAKYASWAAAMYVTWVSAIEAAWCAAKDTAWAAAMHAARAAASEAERYSADGATWAAAKYAARETARAAQIKIIKSMF